MASRKKAPTPAQAEVETPAPVAQAAVADVPKQPNQNGVTRPRSGTATGRVWEISDALSSQAGKPAARGDVMKAGEAEGLNPATIATQYGRWRKFHGLGRYSEEPVEAAEDPDAPEVDEDEDEDEEEED